MMTKPPDVVLLMSDEHPVFMTGCYGDRLAETPTIDRLARTGAVFTSAYCASPICAPCRAALMTSRYVHDIEVWDNASPLRSDWPTFAHRFAAAGYRTILCGKMHFVGPDQHHGFTDRWVPDIYPATFNWTRGSRTALPIQDHPQGQNRFPVLAAGPGRTSDMDYDDVVVATAEGRIPSLAASEEPFLLVISLTGPHYPFQAPAEWWDRYAEIDPPLPQWPTDHRLHEHPAVRWIRTSGQFDEAIPTDAVRRARIAIYARIAMLDAHLDRLQRALEQAVAHRPRFTCYCSDHGDMLGEHELFYKNTAYEWSSRIPLVFTGPGIAQRRIAETVGLHDLGPTLGGLAGIPELDVPSAGRDLAPLLRGERAATRGRAVIENYGEGLRRGIRTLVRGRFKLSLGHELPGELFDLERDPGEWTNRYADPAYARIRDLLERDLRRDWGDPAAHDEARWQSEERRLAILKGWCGLAPRWQQDWRELTS